VLSTKQEVILARNAIGAHAQYFMVNHELQLPIPKAFVQDSRSVHATRNA